LDSFSETYTKKRAYHDKVFTISYDPPALPDQGIDGYGTSLLKLPGPWHIIIPGLRRMKDRILGGMGAI
jgi:hypothetical protein